MIEHFLIWPLAVQEHMDSTAEARWHDRGVSWLQLLIAIFGMIATGVYTARSIEQSYLDRIVAVGNRVSVLEREIDVIKERQITSAQKNAEQDANIAKLALENKVTLDAINNDVLNLLVKIYGDDGAAMARRKRK